MPYTDPLMQRAAQYRYYLKNKKRVATTSYLAQQEKRAYLRALKDTPCTDCGKRYPPYCMDLDHLDQSSKLFCPSNLPKFSWKKLLAEVAKCEVVCAICHRIRTHEKQHHLYRKYEKEEAAINIDGNIT